MHFPQSEILVITRDSGMFDVCPGAIEQLKLIVKINKKIRFNRWSAF